MSSYDLVDRGNYPYEIKQVSSEVTKLEVYPHTLRERHEIDNKVIQGIRSKKDMNSIAEYFVELVILSIA